VLAFQILIEQLLLRQFLTVLVKKEVDHELYDFSWSVVVTRFTVFGKASYKFFKDVAISVLLTVSG